MDVELNKLIEYLDNESSIIKLMVDHNGTITHACKYAEKLAGKKLSGTSLKDFFTDFNAQLDINQMLTKGVTKQMLNINTYRNLPETLYFTSIPTQTGIILIGEVNNIELEELRQSMINLNNDLNNLTRELQKKNIQLDQLNKLKNQFLGIAAHDLRNPIASILMFSDFVLESKEDEINGELKQILEMIRNSSQFMLNLLEELLDVVKIESGKIGLNLVKVEMEDLLRKNIKMNSIIAANKEIDIILNIPQPVPPISADPVKIEQVMNNLISNAIKYSHKNTTITVYAFSTGDEILVSVQDQGQGIPKNELDKIFVPFAKISVQATSGEKSTGLGLSIVRRIIIGHQGRIWVESEQGKGSKFYFTLPIKNN
ncbi:MAG: HAMP domain-containing histidine kinase [Sphingobacteriia bacterium]|nr:HAMP domain-containing histidine kinase [Sphingobacteriia bacterium]